MSAPVERASVLARRDRFLAGLGARPRVMGILNVTPDSFSDGGRFVGLDAALAQARRMAEEGADIIDVGAESTRPGHTPVSGADELARLEPLLAPLAAAVDLPFSVDTYKAAVARRAVEWGASVVNDVWGLQRDPAMADVVAETGAAVVVMHNRDEKDERLDIRDDMRLFFARSLALADRAGVPRAHVLLDPGIGFGKTKEQNLAALADVGDLARDFGLPVLVGVSRKSIFGLLLGAAVDARLIGTLAANLVCAARGASVFRVHDVAEHVAAFKVFDAIARA
jgi:dihydropteroate synthase